MKGKIKPQGVRFRIYKFSRDEFGKETLDDEIPVDEKTKITWRVTSSTEKRQAGSSRPEALPLLLEMPDMAGLG